MTRYKIAVLGEAWGADEAAVGLPFVGASGRLLNELLEEAEIERSECFVTNVFNLQPQPTNDVKNLCTSKELSTVPWPQISAGAYLQDRYWPEVLRARKELQEAQPNLVLALGNTAVWALTGDAGIKKLRGTVTPSTSPPGLKILPTYHPAYVMRDWAVRPVVLADLLKAKRQSEFPEIRRPRRTLWLDPTLKHIELFYDQYIRRAKTISFDIETAGKTQITCVGFSPSSTLGIVIPFVDNRKPGGSYWPTLAEERTAWEWVRRYLATPALKVGQNTLYDINWLWSRMGITVNNYDADTMLKHHALNPEMEKSLGFLGSVYTDEPAWKTMRSKGMFTTKRGE